MALALIDTSAVLPIVSLVATCGAIAFAAVSWKSRNMRNKFAGWEVSGALAFIAIGASVIGEPDYVVRLLSQREPQ